MEFINKIELYVTNNSINDCIINKISDHSIIVSNYKFNCMTFNTDHCFNKYLRCLKSSGNINNDNFCILKEIETMKYIKKFIDDKYDFILLQECSFQLKKK